MPDDAIEIRYLEIDGVRVIHSPRSGPTLASLLFRVGFGDEPLHRRGLCHIIEHMVLHGFEDSEYPYNGSVTPFHTSFDVKGTTEEVTDFLERVTAGLNSIDYSHFDHERAVLKVEAENRDISNSTIISAFRWGATGIGSAAYPEYALDEATPAEIEAFRKKYFVRENAVLWIYGPLPEKLTFSLFNGESFPVPPRKAIDRNLPAKYEVQHAPVGFSMLLDRGAPAASLNWILEQRLTKTLRHGLGLVYSVNTQYTLLDDDTAELVVLVDHTRAYREKTSSEMLKVLTDLSRGGNLQEDIDSYKRMLARQDQDPDLVPGHLDYLARAALSGKDAAAVEAERIAGLQTLNENDIRDVLNKGLTSLIVVAPKVGETDFVLNDFYVPDVEIEGTRYDATPGARKQGLQYFIISDTALSCVYGGDARVVATIEFSNVAVVERSPHRLDIYDFRDRSIDISDNHLLNGVEALERLRNLIPAELFVKGPEAATKKENSPVSQFWTAVPGGIAFSVALWSILPIYVAIPIGIAASIALFAFLKPLRTKVRELKTKRHAGALFAAGSILNDADFAVGPEQRGAASWPMKLVYPYGPSGTLVIDAQHLSWTPSAISRSRRFKKFDISLGAIVTATFGPSIMTGYEDLTLSLRNGDTVTFMAFEDETLRALLSEDALDHYDEDDSAPKVVADDRPFLSSFSQRLIPLGWIAFVILALSPWGGDETDYPYPWWVNVAGYGSIFIGLLAVVLAALRQVIAIPLSLIASLMFLIVGPYDMHIGDPGGLNEFLAGIGLVVISFVAVVRDQTLGLPKRR